MATFKVGEVEYDLIESKLTFAEARAVEKVSGVSFQQITQDPATRGSLDVIQALIWVSMKRSDPSLKFSDLDDLAIDEIEWSTDDEEQEDEEAARPTEGEVQALPINA